MTGAEAAQILGISGVVAQQPYPELPTCEYRDEAGSPVAGTTLNPDGRQSFDLLKGSTGIQDVAGLGDDAFFEPTSAALLVLKGSTLYSVTVGTGSDPEAQRLEWAKQFAAIAVGRIP